MSGGENIAPGTMMLWAGGAGQYSASSNGAIAAPGWLYCDGQTVPKTTYPALYAAIADRYNTGGEAVGTFRLPGVSGYMTKATTAATNAEHVAGASHNHTIVNTSGLGINAVGAGGSHNHGGGSLDQTASAHYTHTQALGHGALPGFASNAGNSGVAGRAAGTANVSIASHLHAAGSAANSAVTENNNSSGNGHNWGVNVNAEAAHTHSVTFSSTPGTPTSTSISQATMDLWHIIKI